MSYQNKNAASVSCLGTSAWALVAVLFFHAAHEWGIGWLMIPCCYALIELSRQPIWRRAFYPMLLIGLGFYGPQLTFFCVIFGGGAIALWLVLAFWVALFGALLRLARDHFGEIVSLSLAPSLWTGLEYFRGELYFLRFTWLTLGMAQAPSSGAIEALGVYGFGFLSMAIAAGLHALRSSSVLRTASLLASAVLLGQLLSPITKRNPAVSAAGVHVAGVQLEFQNEYNILRSLDQVLEKFPDAELLMLSEYTFDGAVPQRIREWCREHRRYLVAGGKESIGTNGFYNTAYVVGPEGEICHRQVKSVPIQFFTDGLPAPKREVWNSPWGPLGILICYDLSYTRVVDDFVRQGARALLVPTMDVADWGRREHELHARVAPQRAVEYGIPIFRVCSSGISQLINASGESLASAPFPGAGVMIGGLMPLVNHAGVPWDRFLAKAAVAATLLILTILVLKRFRKRTLEPASPNQSERKGVFSSVRP